MLEMIIAISAQRASLAIEVPTISYPVRARGKIVK